MLHTQPSAEPSGGVPIDQLVRLSDRAKLEVAGPANKRPIDAQHHGLGRQPGAIARRLLVDFREQPTHTLLRRARADEGPPRLSRVAPTERVTQEVEVLFRRAAHVSLALV